MSKRQLLLLSNSTMHGSGYLEYASDEIKSLMSRNNVSKVLFIPYALHDKDSYEHKARKGFAKLGFALESIHRSNDPVEAVNQAEAIFVGGGNTFRLLRALYDNKLIDSIRNVVLQQGTPYMGASAGTNVATVNICTTNDMPIVYPQSFNALNLVPFNINPHYIEPEANSTHMGETREERIKQYFEEEEHYPVLGLKEGSILEVDGDKAFIRGLSQPAKLFTKDNKPQEYPVGADVSFLLKGVKN
ncbi:alpha-aspartyl dipeptidase-like [Macrosteles quadrilineatus]|uniref:alpha-aspartyl dipeptidase-like n=1 Tax=Macrosteles quadrilineatus TaxID=74068 RepID=UPI0023E26940|nr:alpha-aspartyl dipeptidase-like [Macrosteles quadrilineatus]XP_054283986.1 alpha-aspartyl dipeptidase-like [Macrosteles quadrilineatus]